MFATLIFCTMISLNISSRYPIQMRSCPAYGGAQPALLPFFQSMQQASTSRAEAFLDTAYRHLLSHHIFRLEMSPRYPLLSRILIMPLLASSCSPSLQPPPSS